MVLAEMVHKLSILEGQGGDVSSGVGLAGGDR